MKNLFKKKPKIDNYSLTNGVGLIVQSEPNSIISEQFNTIRTNIQFSSVDKEIDSIIFTSSHPSEGKSTVSNNLAVSWAKQGEKVILIDADMRRPTIHKTFAVSNATGLSNYLSGKAELTQIIQETVVDNLYVIPSGPIPPNPSELLASPSVQMMVQDLKEIFQLSIFDVPPVNSVTDAQILATKVDGVVLVIPEGIAEKRGVIRAKQSLDTIHANILGAVMNRVKSNNLKNGYGNYYGVYK